MLYLSQRNVICPCSKNLSFKGRTVSGGLPAGVVRRCVGLYAQSAGAEIITSNDLLIEQLIGTDPHKKGIIGVFKISKKVWEIETNK